MMTRPNISFCINERILQNLSLIQKEIFSHVIIEHPWHGWLGKYKITHDFKLIVHAHNIEHFRIKARNKIWWRLLKTTEQKAFLRADYILFKTEADKTIAIKLFKLSPAKCLIVPYGVIENEQPAVTNELKELLRKKNNIHPEEKLLLFAGTLEYEPNARAIEIITSHIIPQLQKKNFRFKLIICGPLPARTMSYLNAIPGVSTVGFVSAVEDYLRTADVFINPVVGGSGIQTKNIEAIANGCNVVTTAFASTGMPEYLAGKKLFVSPDNDWESFTDNIIMASVRTEPVPQEFYRKYNWQFIIEELLRRIVISQESES